MPSPTLSLADTSGRVAQYICDRLGGTQSQSGWRGHCPAHDDLHPSLDTRITPENGKLLVIRRTGGALALKRLGAWPEPLPDTLPSPFARRIVAFYPYRDPERQLISIKNRYECVERGETRNACS